MNLGPGKVPGHNVVSYEREFDPKGFYRYTFKPATDRAELSGLHSSHRAAFSAQAAAADAPVAQLRAVGG